jgi:hypothetical protein
LSIQVIPEALVSISRGAPPSVGTRFPGPPYWNGRSSNGSLAVEDMAAILDKPLLDYAYAATTGLGNLIDGGTVEQLGSLGVPGITTAYNTTIDSIPHDTIRHSLFLVYGGFNDFSIGELTTATADRAVANLVRLTGHLECVSVPSRLILVC